MVTKVVLPTLRHSTGGGGHVVLQQLTHYSCPQGARDVRKVYNGCFCPSTAVLAGFLFTVLLSKLAYRFFHSARAVFVASSPLLCLGLGFCQPTSRPFVDTRPFVNSRPFVDSRTFVDSCPFIDSRTFIDFWPQVCWVRRGWHCLRWGHPLQLRC